MSDYRAPVKDMRFVMDEIAGFNELAQLPAFAEATPDLADAILDEAAKFAGEVIAPLNRIGDQQGCQLDAGGVRTPRWNLIWMAAAVVSVTIICAGCFVS